MFFFFNSRDIPQPIIRKWLSLSIKITRGIMSHPTSILHAHDLIQICDNIFARTNYLLPKMGFVGVFYKKFKGSQPKNQCIKNTNRNCNPYPKRSTNTMDKSPTKKGFLVTKGKLDAWYKHKQCYNIVVCYWSHSL